MARGNFRDYLRGEQVRAKKYFYVLRPLLACAWIDERGTPPPMEFEALLDAMLPSGDPRPQILDLLARKRAGV